MGRIHVFANESDFENQKLAHVITTGTPHRKKYYLFSTVSEGCEDNKNKVIIKYQVSRNISIPQ